MKKTFYFKLLTIILLSGLFVSCSKEKISFQESAVTFTNDAQNKFDTNVKSGGVTGVVIPGNTKGFIMLYGDNNKFGPYYLNIDGSYKITDIPAGNYKFVLNWLNPNDISDNNYSSISISVDIVAGQITNLKPIYL